ncbi:MAG: hypothetical protein JXK95_01090 [Bacteroidales bacterium]|nr:hypothetical protein [Bacteroidales bacterium]
MPSLSPGTPGAKEAYGISIIRDDLSIKIPPKALNRYGLSDNDIVLLCTTRIGEGGFGILNKEKAYKSVFKTVIDKIDKLNSIFYIKSKAYALTEIIEGKVLFTEQLLEAFNLKKGDRLLVIKSTTVSMSYSPVEVWKRKFEQRGFFEAVENMKKLEEF